MKFLIEKLRWVYIRNNLPSFFFTASYIILTMILFWTRFYQYSDTMVGLAIARASAFVIYFHSCMVILLILRKSISFIRSIGMGHYLPLDHYVYFHKLTGWSIAFFSLLHTFAHVYNFATLTTITKISYFSFLFSLKLGIGWFFGAACLTGWICLGILLIILVLSLNFIRRTGNFEVFFYSHKLYIVYIFLLFIHAKLTFKFLVLPLTLFIFEKISAFIKTKKDHHGMTYAIEGTLLPSRVLRLVIRKPKFFVFNPGDFVYVMVPSITKYEWHPITISSAPENEDITIHIRAIGEWTNRMHDHFEHAKTLSLKNMLENWKCIDTHPRFMNLNNDNNNDYENNEDEKKEISLSKQTMILPIPEDCDENGCKKKLFFKENTIEMEELKHGKEKSSLDANVIHDSLVKFEKLQKNLNTKAIFLKEPLKIHLDGPYGAPSSNIFQSEHAVLIATGIGVTPFASILQSVMARHIEKTRLCPQCNYTWVERVPSQLIMSLKKVDFIWINRDQTSFEWFVQLLSDLNKQQYTASDERFFDIHMYVTGKQKSDLSSLNLSNEKSFNWNFSRPNWEEIFEYINNQNRGRVTVFFCGRPDLSSFLRNMCCSKYKFGFKKEVF